MNFIKLASPWQYHDFKSLVYEHLISSKQRDVFWAVLTSEPFGLLGWERFPAYLLLMEFTYNTAILLNR